jgi:hypothetical protein
MKTEENHRIAKSPIVISLISNLEILHPDLEIHHPDLETFSVDSRG